MELTKSRLISFLKKYQELSGEFKSFCYLPTAENSEWYYTGVSPFVTANILYCLQEIKTKESKEIINKGIAFLMNIKEDIDLWRYWEHNSEIMEYNVPNDLDDTCLSSYIIEKNSVIRLKNKEIIQNNKNKNHTFNTWILPNLKNITNLKFSLFLIREFFKTKKVFLPNNKLPNNENISSINDTESTVDATVALYLRHSEGIDKTIDYLKKEILANSTRLQYYDQPHFVYYHLSRVYSEKIFNSGDIKQTILDYIDRIELTYNYQENYLEQITSLLTLINFKWINNDTYQRLKKHILAEPMLYDNQWKPFKYWTSKQRSWWAGSKELTAALYLESLIKINTL